MISGMFVVAHVMITATNPKKGPYCMTRQWPCRSDRTPNSGDRSSSEA
jgi:hypothetical protein